MCLDEMNKDAENFGKKFKTKKEFKKEKKIQRKIQLNENSFDNYEEESYDENEIEFNDSDEYDDLNEYDFEDEDDANSESYSLLFIDNSIVQFSRIITHLKDLYSEVLMSETSKINQESPESIYSIKK